VSVLPDPLRPGTSGPAVRDVQSRLNDLGHDLSDDDPAVYGQATESAIRSFH
jgi:peptidoglycan hydrolase-like protein with peptidoglycan-binding domain